MRWSRLGPGACVECGDTPPFPPPRVAPWSQMRHWEKGREGGREGGSEGGGGREGRREGEREGEREGAREGHEQPSANTNSQAGLPRLLVTRFHI